MLEKNIQNPVNITRCFINGNYRFYKRSDFKVSTLRNFLNFLSSASVDKKRIIMNNIWQRLDTIERFIEEDDNLPF